MTEAVSDLPLFLYNAVPIFMCVCTIGLRVYVMPVLLCWSGCKGSKSYIRQLNPSLLHSCSGCSPIQVQVVLM